MSGMDRSKFKHRTEVGVRNYEVDWQGVVHNANYLNYFELGRIEYLKYLGFKVDVSTIQDDAKIVLVRNEINYKAPARFDDLLSIFTRVIYIRNTSFAFEGVIEAGVTGRTISENIAIHVWLDRRTGEPVTVGEDFRKKVQQFEKENVAIFGPSLYT